MNAIKNALFAKLAVLMCAGFLGMAMTTSIVSGRTVAAHADDIEVSTGSDVDAFEGGNITSEDLAGVADRITDGFSDVQKVLIKITNVAFVVVVIGVGLVILLEHDPKGFRTKITAIAIAAGAGIIVRLAAQGTFLKIIDALAGKV